MQKTLKTKILIGILAALSALGVLVAHELRVSKQTADAASKLAAERDKAKQIDQDDKAAIQKIRERNAQKAASTTNQK
jgi:hypothetical protein